MRQFVGGHLDWLSPFSLMCGAGLVVGYALIGGCWLVVKTLGGAEKAARLFAKPLLLTLVASILLISVWALLHLSAWRSVGSMA